MAWIAVDRNQSEWIFKKQKPFRCDLPGEWHNDFDDGLIVELGTAKNLTGSPMKWEDEPREIEYE
jgi:hypothetical protein